MYFSNPHTCLQSTLSSGAHFLFITHQSSPAYTHTSCKSDNFIVHYIDNIWNSVSGITTWRLKIDLKARTDRFTVHDINNIRSLQPRGHHMNQQVSSAVLFRLFFQSHSVFCSHIHVQAMCVQNSTEIDF